MRYAITNRKRRIAVKSKKLVILLFICLVTTSAFSQKKDSLSKKIDTSSVNKHSPKKATIMSACLPGLGQAYNKKYWKIPIIYAGAAGVTYAVIFNSHYYKLLKLAYQYRTDGDSSTIDNYPNYSTDELQALRDYYRRNMELSYIIGGAIYILNIIDADVDAHLYHFDISDNLTMNIDPFFIPSQNHSFAGLSFSFTFGKKIKNLHF